MDFLHNTTLVMLISPSAMGKSSLIDQLLAIDARLSRVKSFTTRPPRPDDASGQLFYFDEQTLADKRTRGDVVSEVTFPTTGYAYGTVRESYSSDICILETLANSVETYRALPFKRTIAISITAPAELWHQRFTARYPEPSDEALKRLEEARLSMQWSLAQTTDHHWVSNDASLDAVARRILAIIDETSPSVVDTARQNALECEQVSQAMWSNSSDTLQ